MAEQIEAIRSRVAEEWRRVRISTKRVDRTRAESAIASLYALVGLPRPDIRWASSPSMAIAIARPMALTHIPLVRATSGGRDHRSPLDVDESMYAFRKYGAGLGMMRAVISAWGKGNPEDRSSKRTVWERLLEPELGEVGLPGQFDGLYPFLDWSCPRGDFDLVPAEVRSHLDAWLEVDRSVGPWYPFEDAAVVSDRPALVRLDAKGEPHCPDGPALVYADGFEVYALKGHRFDRTSVVLGDVPVRTVLRRELDPSRWRILLHHIGPERIAKDEGATLVDEDATSADVHRRLWSWSTGGSDRRWGPSGWQEDPVSRVRVLERIQTDSTLPLLFGDAAPIGSDFIFVPEEIDRIGELDRREAHAIKQRRLRVQQTSGPLVRTIRHRSGGRGEPIHVFIGLGNVEPLLDGVPDRFEGGTSLCGQPWKPQELRDRPERSGTSRADDADDDGDDDPAIVAKADCETCRSATYWLASLDRRAEDVSDDELPVTKSAAFRAYRAAQARAARRALQLEAEAERRAEEAAEQRERWAISRGAACPVPIRRRLVMEFEAEPMVSQWTQSYFVSRNRRKGIWTIEDHRAGDVVGGEDHKFRTLEDALDGLMSLASDSLEYAIHGIDDVTIYDAEPTEDRELHLFIHRLKVRLDLDEAASEPDTQ